ncbi:MAG: Glutamate racemase, partial [uncultured Corynebacteriales bacterium]
DRSGRADRDLRLRGRRPHGGPGGARPAAGRAAALRRRHRPRPVRPAAHRRGPPARAGRDGRARRPGREAAGDRVQHGQRGLPARRPGAVRRAGGRGGPARGAAGRRRHPDRPDRRDWHHRHGDQRGVPGRVRRGPAGPGDRGGLPAVRRLRGAGPDQRPAGARAGPGVPRPAGRGRRRHARPGLHPLPAADRGDPADDGGRRDAGVQRRGDRQGRLPGADRDRCPAAGGRPAAAAPVRGDRGPGAVLPAGPALPRARGRRGVRGVGV